MCRRFNKRSSMKDKYEDDMHNVTNQRLAQMIRELARRHVEKDQETLLEAARRIENIDNIHVPFNSEAFG